MKNVGKKRRKSCAEFRAPHFRNQHVILRAIFLFFTVFCGLPSPSSPQKTRAARACGRVPSEKKRKTP